MDKSDYKSLLILVNDERSNDALTLYANKRIEMVRKDLEHAVSWEQARLFQGQLMELRRLLTLRSEVNAKAHNG